MSKRQQPSERPNRRHPVAEAVARRERNRFNDPSSVVSDRTYTLGPVIAKIDEYPRELLKWVPVALVACMEAFFRLSITQLLDTRDDFARAATRFQLNVKLDLEMIRAIQGKSWSFGELVAHSLPMNNLDQIASHVTEIVGKDFLRELTTHVDRWSVKMGNSAVPMLQNPDETYKSVVRTFELRHVFAHEVATAYQPDRNEIVKCYYETMKFLQCASSYLADVAYPNHPLTQSEMNEVAFNDFQEAEKQRLEVLNELYAQMKRNVIKDRSEQFRDTDAAWCAYREKRAQWEADEGGEGGTIWPTLHAATLTTLTEEYTASLRKLVEVHRGDVLESSH